MVTAVFSNRKVSASTQERTRGPVFGVVSRTNVGLSPSDSLPLRVMVRPRAR
ncbi:hypothetical protein D3C83_334280 [compost metagenome]